MTTFSNLFFDFSKYFVNFAFLIVPDYEIVTCNMLDQALLDNKPVK